MFTVCNTGVGALLCAIRLGIALLSGETMLARAGGAASFTSSLPVPFFSLMGAVESTVLLAMGAAGLDGSASGLVFAVGLVAEAVFRGMGAPAAFAKLGASVDVFALRVD